MTTKQYREVKRKAAVGERIKIVAPRHGYDIGSTWIVEDADYAWGGCDRDGTGVGIDGGRPLFHEKYVVLEPFESAPSPLTADPLYAAFRQFVADNADGIRAILPELDGSAITADAITVGAIVPRHIPLTRAQIIAKATADVAELERIGGDSSSDLPEGTPFEDMFYKAEFHVNRDKRAVTALIRYAYGDTEVRAKHTAKCSPADVFHETVAEIIIAKEVA